MRYREQAQPWRHLVIASSLHLDDELYFDGSIQRQNGYTERTARVNTLIAKDSTQHFTRTVNHQRL
jgi:hypothetical protein